MHKGEQLREGPALVQGRALPPEFKACEGGSCNNPVPDEKERNRVHCKTTDSCKHDRCECHLFSYDPKKDTPQKKDPWQHDAGPNKEFDKEHGRTYHCLCVTPVKK